jgi:hypothetical protein
MFSIGGGIRFRCFLFVILLGRLRRRQWCCRSLRVHVPEIQIRRSQCASGDQVLRVRIFVCLIIFCLLYILRLCSRIVLLVGSGLSVHDQHHRKDHCHENCNSNDGTDHRRCQPSSVIFIIVRKTHIFSPLVLSLCFYDTFLRAFLHAGTTAHTFLRINDCMEILDLHSIVLAILYADTAAHTAGLAGLHGNRALVRRTAGYLYRIGIRP